ncbi:patatin [Croceicoccus estronivorus]|uniref:patatin-like protein n=1 Tax=Croceicoccus estronivorus TaxID=1172626 RepID=UPI000836C546|nr:patatin-like protein [Croceicoccus estronivorus]OCC24545.1 patatin [Croceicoccus estronivorus]
MRQKELRIALVCYGGVSLAVYMHGVTKEIWKLARASRSTHSGKKYRDGSEAVYCDLLRHIDSEHGLMLRILPDILTGASAGGINAVFLAEAIHSGRSLEPLTELWLENADVDRLLDPEARPWSRVAKQWAWPIVQFLLTRPGNAVSESVAPETRQEVRAKLSRFIRSRWFAPPFSGIGFSRLLCKALTAMRGVPAEDPLLPAGHPIDLFVTATDFRGYPALLRLNSPPVIEESEHRLPIGFHGRTPAAGGTGLADPLELVFAARSTASFPGAFPPLQLSEIDALGREHEHSWTSREQFLTRVMPGHVRRGDTETVSLIDGSVLVNAPFAEAAGRLTVRPAQREVDRRFVYIDPRPDRSGNANAMRNRPVGFFGAIFGSLSTIPREQPIRDNLEELEEQSREAERLQLIVAALRPEVEHAVEQLFGHTLFLDKPTQRRLRSWRNRAQQAAAEKSGFAFHGYAQAKFTGIIDHIARTIFEAAPDLGLSGPDVIAERLRMELMAQNLERLSDPKGGASKEAIAFLRAHDIAFRIRRLRFLARRLSREWEEDSEISEQDRERAKKLVYDSLALYFERESTDWLGAQFAADAENVMANPGAALEALERLRDLPGVDEKVEAMFAAELTAMPKALRRRMLLAYLGFPFFDVATLPLLRNEGLTEFDPVKIDRISPEDARSIRDGGTQATLRGTEFYNFGAFFSRAYRENDYLWGRLHGAERMIDLVVSTLDNPMPLPELTRYKRAAFLAVLDEEEPRLTADKGLIEKVRQEVIDKFG